MRRPSIALRLLSAAIFLFILLMSNSQAFAIKDGGDIYFKDTRKLAPVLFSHDGHKEAGEKCKTCHPKVFKMKTGSANRDNALTMKSMKKGKYCGTCHDGERAFTVKKHCKKCHVKAR